MKALSSVGRGLEFANHAKTLCGNVVLLVTALHDTGKSIIGFEGRDYCLTRQLTGCRGVSPQLITQAYTREASTRSLRVTGYTSLSTGNLLEMTTSSSGGSQLHSNTSCAIKRKIRPDQVSISLLVAPETVNMTAHIGDIG
jgi:hypothetical protein